MKRVANAFTLIELLVVVAIIGILAAIAINNMLLAQIKSKVARVQADQTSYKTAHEAYRIDNEQYLETDRLPLGLRNNPMESRWVPLTTPIAYISTIPKDPFGDKVYPSWVVQTYDPKARRVNWRYSTYDFVSGNEPIGDKSKRPWAFHDAFIVDLRRRGQTDPAWEQVPKNLLYFMTSQGPDGIVPPFEAVVYDPSNGLRSRGDIFKFGP